MSRLHTNILIAIVVSIIVIIIALVASENAQYTNPIHSESGVTLVSTSNGDKVYSDIEYINSIVSVKPTAILSIATLPVTLPNTSNANGINECTLNSNNGTLFTVHTNDTCDTLQ